ncbi:hypothetical protein [Gordonia paraffinivorans]|uniref:hypothetical protein n=1 Tax=Gordonia paraffinivorans TaxID=175628 RepID=UPI0014456CFD|nr:hypothetical protein [Gordonia paraffinivorans]
MSIPCAVEQLQTEGRWAATVSPTLPLWPNPTAGIAPIGVIMPMSVGSILMSLTTVVVALNAQLLRRLDLRPDALSSQTAT